MTPEQLEHKLSKSAQNMAHATRTGVNRAAAKLAAAEEASLSAATGGTMLLRGTKSTKPMGVKLLPATKPTNSTAVVRGNPAPLWSWLEKGVKPHDVGNKGDTRPLMHWDDVFAYGPFLLSAHSPAEHTFSGPVNVEAPTMVRTVETETWKAITHAFR